MPSSSWRGIGSEGVHVGIANVTGGIGSDDRYAPATIAEKLWGLAQGRDDAEVTY